MRNAQLGLLMLTYRRIGQYTTNTLRASCHFCRVVKRYVGPELLITQSYGLAAPTKKETGRMPVLDAGMPGIGLRSQGNLRLGRLLGNRNRFYHRLVVNGHAQLVSAGGQFA